MKLLLAGLATVGSIGSGATLAGKLFWSNEAWLERHLNHEDQVTVPVSHLLPAEHSLCTAGSYQTNLPDGYEIAQQQLDRAGLLPVEEGVGLLFSVDGSRHVLDVSTLSVWPDVVVLEAASPVCIPTASAQHTLRREGSSIVIKLDDGG